MRQAQHENKVISFECSESSGEEGVAGCSNSCKKKGFNGYQYFEDETCNALFEKIEGEKIKLRIKDIQIGPVEIGIDQKRATTLAELEESSPVGTTALRVYVGKGTIEPSYDTFEIPGALGGGSHTTTSFGGTIHFRLEQTAPGSQVYRVIVTGVDTTAASMNLNGYETGTLQGDLNPQGYNTGELNLATGEISLLFSQLIYADSIPGVPITSHSAYFGTCRDCLNGGEVSLVGDSIYIAPFDF